MSKIALTPSATGTGVFTISSPATSTNRTLTLPDETGTVLTSGAALPAISGAALTGIGLVKTGSVTYDTATATGTQAITGVGFTPKLISLWAVTDSVDEYSDGFSDGTTNIVSYGISGGIAGAWRSSSAYIIFLYQGSTVRTTSTLQSFDADGFTLAHTKTGAKTGTATFNYTVWG
jgi:hypothetical protein